MSLTLAFSHGTDWISRLIAWISFSEWTHVALVRGEQVIEASGQGYPKGVRLVSLWEWLMRHPGAVLREIEHPCPDDVWRMALTQVGTDYDWAWLLRYLLRADWVEDDAWTCSELVAWASASCSVPLFDGQHLQRVTPQDLFDISKEH